MSGIRPSSLIEHLKNELIKPFVNPSKIRPIRNLDFYIEAQIHGDIDLKADVDYLITDPSFTGTATEDNLIKMCSLFNIEHSYHSGFVLNQNEVPNNFRGPKMPSMAARIAKDGIINARLIGEAAADLRNNPSTWADRGSYDDVLQELKLLWHTVVKYGS